MAMETRGQPIVDFSTDCRSLAHKNRMEITGEKPTIVHDKRHGKVKKCILNALIDGGFLGKDCNFVCNLCVDYGRILVCDVPTSTNVSLPLPLPVKMTISMKSSAFATT